MIMSIPITGTYLLSRRLGRVADFCPQCQLAQPFDLVRFRRFPFVLYIPVWFGTTSHHEIRCTQCKGVLPADPSRYAQVTKDKRLPLADLVRLTNPGVVAELEERERLIEKIETGEVTTEQKVQLCVEAILASAQEVEKRGNDIHFDGGSGLAMAMLFVAPWGVYELAKKWRFSADVMTVAVAGSAAAVLIYLIWRVATDTRRYCRAKVFPKIVPALATYQPTLEEVKRCVELFRGQGLKIGYALRPNDLHQAIERFRGAHT